MQHNPDEGAAKRADGLMAHPSVRAVMARGEPPMRAPVTPEHMRQLALDHGADDAAVVSLDHPDLAEEREHVRRAMPDAASLVVLVKRMHPDSVRSPQRSVANREFHHAGETVDDVAHHLVRSIAELGARAINPAMAFPMEMDAFPGRTWIVSYKRVAVAAGLGQMGLHRSVIHPRFGSFILLGAVITNVPVEAAPAALDFNPCVDCKLCVAACPVGAIEPDGTFRFSACMDHNYREFMTGFSDFAEELADSRDRHDFRDRVPLRETVSLWQSLSYKPNYKAAYCMAVCPAGEDVLGPFLRDRAGHLQSVMKPLTARREPVFVVKGSDAEAHVKRRFPHKEVRVIRSSLRPSSPAAFFHSMPLIFQRGPATGWKATFHFTLTGGSRDVVATVRINNGTLEVEHAHVGVPDVRVHADGQGWLDLVSGRRSVFWSVITRRVRVRGKAWLMGRFAACFPR